MTKFVDEPGFRYNHRLNYGREATTVARTADRSGRPARRQSAATAVQLPVLSSHLRSEYRNRVEPGMKLLPWWYVGSRVVAMIRPGVLTVSS